MHRQMEEELCEREDQGKARMIITKWLKYVINIFYTSYSREISAHIQRTLFNGLVCFFL